MVRRSQEIKASLTRSGVKVYILSKYVDDVDIATHLIGEGMRGTGEGLQRKEEETGEPAEERTMRLIVHESSKQVPGIKSTLDLPCRHENGRCPVLDLEVLAERGV